MTFLLGEVRSGVVAWVRLRALCEGVKGSALVGQSKSAATITVPRNLDADDWEMVKMMLETYIIRMQKRSPKK
jgi:hypothetical protein